MSCQIKSGVCSKIVSEIIYRWGNMYYACWKCARAVREQREEDYVIPPESPTVDRHEEIL